MGLKSGFNHRRALAAYYRRGLRSYSDIHSVKDTQTCVFRCLEDGGVYDD